MMSFAQVRIGSRIWSSLVIARHENSLKRRFWTLIVLTIFIHTKNNIADQKIIKIDLLARESYRQTVQINLKASLRKLTILG